jgi:hypothetical protein
MIIKTKEEADMVKKKIDFLSEKIDGRWESRQLAILKAVALLNILREAHLRWCMENEVPADTSDVLPF